MKTTLLSLLALSLILPFSLQAQGVPAIQVDIVLEPQTTTPAFYQGRGEMATLSQVRATAIVTGGTEQDHTYRWQIGRAEVIHTSVTGENSITFTADNGLQTPVAVTVINQEGTVVASSNIVVPHVQSETHFYEAHPLYGLNRNAIAGQHPFLGEEMTIKAEPYFLHADTFTNNPLLLWSINSKAVVNQVDDQQFITFQRSGFTGSFVIEFQLQNQEVFGHDSDGRFTLVF